VLPMIVHTVVFLFALKERQKGVLSYGSQHLEEQISKSATVDQLCVNTIRALSIDAIRKRTAGIREPDGLAPVRIVVTVFCGTARRTRTGPIATALCFPPDTLRCCSTHLHLTGYDLPLSEIERFPPDRLQVSGHPEFGVTPGVETTTGPLGQGVANSWAWPSPSAGWRLTSNRDEDRIVDYRVYSICSDGDLMEGISHEAAALAGHLKLSNLIWLYDSNYISLDGPTTLAYSDDVEARFRATTGTC